MKLTWHIVWKDLVRLRGWLALWVLALAVPILDGVELIWRQPFSPTVTDWNRTNVHAGMVVVQMIMGYLMAVFLFNEDRVAGTRQFWSTRPVAGFRLWIAKALAAGIIEWLVPVLVALPWWWWCGFDGGQIGAAVLDKLAIAVVITIPVALVASLTDTLSRTLVWSLVVAIATFPIFFIVSDRTGNAALLVSRLLLITGAILAEMALVTLARFIWRRQWWPAAALVLGVIATVWCGRLAPWLFVDRPGQWHPERAPKFELRFEGVSASRRPWAPPHVSSELTCRLAVDGSPTLGTTVLYAWQTWRWGNGEESEMFGVPSWRGIHQIWLPDGLHEVASDPETEAWEKARIAEYWRRRGRPEPQPFVPGPPALDLSAFMPDATAATLMAAKPDYSATITLARASLRVADEVPLEAGGWSARYGQGIRIDSARHDADGVELIFVTTRPFSFANIPERAGWRGWIEHGWSHFLLINRDRQECLTVSAPTKPLSLWVCGVEIVWQAERFLAPKVVRNGGWVPREGWLEHATLGVVAISTASIFERTVTAKNVTIEEPKPIEKPGVAGAKP